MKASKFIVLAGGILGILAFFLPMVTVERDGGKVSLSAFNVIKGIDQVTVKIDDELKNLSAASANGEVAINVGADAKKGLEEMKGIVMAFFAPALLLALLGGLGVGRKKFGRVAGAFSLVFGLVGLGIGALLKSAAEGDAGIALTLLLITGLAGVVGGLIALVKPERGPVAVAA